MSSFSFVAHGTPVPQGSMRAFNNRIVASNAARLKPWRDTLTSAALEAADRCGLTVFHGPVIVRACFYFKRPQNHYRTGKNATLLRDSAVEFPIGRTDGDLDKHQRALGDALEAAGVLSSDALITKWVSEKRWCAPGELLTHPGVVVHIDRHTACAVLPPRISPTQTNTPQENA